MRLVVVSLITSLYTERADWKLFPILRTTWVSSPHILSWSSFKVYPLLPSHVNPTSLLFTKRKRLEIYTPRVTLDELSLESNWLFLLSWGGIPVLDSLSLLFSILTRDEIEKFRGQKFGLNYLDAANLFSLELGFGRLHISYWEMETSKWFEASFRYFLMRWEKPRLREREIFANSGPEIWLPEIRHLISQSSFSKLSFNEIFFPALGCVIQGEINMEHGKPSVIGNWKEQNKQKKQIRMVNGVPSCSK